MMGASSGSKAATQAAQDAAWKQSQINSQVDQINSIYGSASREADINDFLGATRSYYTSELEKQKTAADRSLKFAMARNGLTGGSASVDANRTLGENYQTGVLNADRLAQAAASDLRTSDETSRMNLISQAQSGANLTSGASQAAASLTNNLAGAKSSLTTDTLGDVFSGLSNIYTTSKEAAAQRRTLQNYGLVYQPGFGQGGT